MRKSSTVTTLSIIVAAVMTALSLAGLLIQAGRLFVGLPVFFLLQPFVAGSLPAGRF